MVGEGCGLSSQHRSKVQSIIWYCRLFAVTDPVEDLLVAMMTDGADTLREAEVIQRNYLTALSSSPLGTVRVSGKNTHERELSIVCDWQGDSSLPIEARNFARTAEQHLLDDLDCWNRSEDDFLLNVKSTRSEVG